MVYRLPDRNIWILLCTVVHAAHSPPVKNKRSFSKQPGVELIGVRYPSNFTTATGHELVLVSSWAVLLPVVGHSVYIPCLFY